MRRLYLDGLWSLPRVGELRPRASPRRGDRLVLAKGGQNVLTTPEDSMPRLRFDRESSLSSAPRLDERLAFTVAYG